MIENPDLRQMEPKILKTQENVLVHCPGGVRVVSSIHRGCEWAEFKIHLMLLCVCARSLARFFSALSPQWPRCVQPWASERCRDAGIVLISERGKWWSSAPAWKNSCGRHRLGKVTDAKTRDTPRTQRIRISWCVTTLQMGKNIQEV